MKTEYALSGGATRFRFEWPYINRSHIVVLLDDNPVPFEWIDDHEVRVTDPFGGPPLGAKLVIIRQTPDLEDYARIVDTTTMTADQLNLMRRQLLYLIQERSGGIAGYVGSAVGAVTTELQGIDSNLDRIDEILETLTADLQTLDTLRQDVIFAKNEASTLRDELLAEIESTAAETLEIQQAVATLAAGQDDFGARVNQEIIARTTADSALGVRIDEVNARVDTETEAREAAILTVEQARVDGDEALAERVTSLEAKVDVGESSVSALINQEAEARATADAAFTSMQTTLQSAVDAGTTWRPKHTWNFNGTDDGFTTGGSATLTVGSKLLTWAPTVTNPTLNRALTGAEQYVGATATKVRARIRRASGTGAWEGTCFYSTAGHGASTSFRKTISAPADLSVFTIVEWDMAALTAGGTDYVDNTITVLRIDLSSDAGGTWEIDWIAVGESVVVPGSKEGQDLYGQIAQVQQQASTLATDVGNLEANYTVKTIVRSSDGKRALAGIGLAATIDGETGVAQSEVILMADRFLLTPPGDANGTASPIFVAGTVNGVPTTVFPASKIGDQQIAARMLVDGAIETRHLLVKGGVGASLWCDPNGADPSIWTRGSSSYEFPTFADVSDGVVGSRVIRGVSGLPTGALGTTTALVPVNPNRQYRISCWARRSATANGTFYLRVQAYDGDKANAVVRTGTVEGVAIGTAWAQYSWVYTPTSTDRWIAPRLYLNNGGTAGYHEAQGVRFEELIDSSLVVEGGIAADRIDLPAISDNLCYNGSPDIDNLGTAGWYEISSVGAGGTLSVVNIVNATMGSYRYRLTLADSVNDGSAMACRAFPVVPGKTYRIRFDYVGTVGKATGFYARIYSGSLTATTGRVAGTLTELITANSPIPAGVTRFEATWTCPAGDYWATLAILNWRGVQHLYFDNLEVYAVGAGTAIRPDSIYADALVTPNLSALSADVGLLRTASTGGRTEIEANQLRVYDATNALRVKLGYLL